MPITTDCSVLIVGAGPVGLALAAFLQNLGVKCRIIDKNPRPTDKSKALVVWPRSLETLDTLGLADTFIKSGFPVRDSIIHAGKKIIAQIHFNQKETAFPLPLMIPQSETERLLNDYLKSVDLPVERELTWLKSTCQQDIMNSLVLSADGKEHHIRSRWVIGCDGAHSVVRKAAGLEFLGEVEPSDWILADCYVQGITINQLNLYFQSSGVLGIFPMGDNRCRIIADLGKAKTPEHPADPTLEQVQDVLNVRGPGGLKLRDPVWLSGFRIHERKVPRYYVNRIILAGDAAHIHSPAGGQGMNTGIQDAFNLGWKLGLIESGKGKTTALLESYSQERSQVGEMVLSNAGRFTRMAILRNPILQWLRNRGIQFLMQFSFFQNLYKKTMTELSIHYPNSILNGECSNSSWLNSGIKPGDRFPDGILLRPSDGGEQRLHRLFHPGSHTLLVLPGKTTSSDLLGLTEFINRIKIAFGDFLEINLILSQADLQCPPNWHGPIWIDPVDWVRKKLGATTVVMALVRPDGYLGYRSQPPCLEDLRAHLKTYLVLPD